MKRYISAKTSIPKLDIVVEVDFLNTAESVAATSYSKDRFANSKLPPAAKNALIDSQVLADYHAFVETIEDLITDYFELQIYYKNGSPYNSFYFGALAADDAGNYILDCEAVIRVSTHDPHRTPESEKNKAIQKAELKKLTDGRRLEPVRKNIIVNNEECADYDEAYEVAFSKIEEAAAKLNRKKN